jgi:hypothetical protein
MPDRPGDGDTYFDEILTLAAGFLTPRVRHVVRARVSVSM